MDTHNGRPGVTPRTRPRITNIMTDGSAHRFPFFRLAGSYREMGEQYGRAARAMIRREAQGTIRAKARETGLKVEEVRRALERFWSDYQRYAPHILDEIEGVAAGAGISPEEALYLRCHWDIAPEALGISGVRGCTSFAVAPERTARGRLIAGQNKDVPWSRIRSVVILDLHPTGGAPASLNYAYVGICEGPGFNSRGLARLEHSLLLNVPQRRGVPSHLLKRLFSESSSIDECVAWVKRIRADRRLGLVGCMVFGECSGRVAAIEFARGDFRVVEGADGLLAHANDPLHPDLRPLDRSETDPLWADSRRRTARMMALLLDGGSRLDIPYLQHCLADHEGRPSSICRHQRSAATVAGLVCAPQEGVLWVSRGHPCRNPFVAYRMKQSQ